MKYLLFVVKAAITLGLIWVVVRNIDITDTAERVRSLSIGAAAAVLGLLLLLALLSIFRWKTVMTSLGQPLGFWLTARLFFEGLFFNQALPSTVGGDGIRIYRAYRAGVTLTGAINSVVLDRILGLTSLMLLAAIAQPLFYQRVDAVGARIAFTAVFLAAIGSVIALLLVAFLPERFHRWKVARGLVALSLATRQAFCTRAIFIPVTLLSIAGHLISVTVFYVLAVSLDLDVGFLDCLIMVPSVLLLATVPISVAGWGLREGATVAAFGLLGVPPGGAAAASVLFGIGMALVALPGGVLWFASGDRDTGEVDALSPESPAKT
ncbi:MAG: lysylphosphatidylglycerol synthase transmembrane domain-containing protein [Gammaproteobacteria bacterium]